MNVRLNSAYVFIFKITLKIVNRANDERLSSGILKQRKTIIWLR